MFGFALHIKKCFPSRAGRREGAKQEPGILSPGASVQRSSARGTLPGYEQSAVKSVVDEGECGRDRHDGQGVLLCHPPANLARGGAVQRRAPVVNVLRGRGTFHKCQRVTAV
jgi:hypothetical protein